MKNLLIAAIRAMSTPTFKARAYLGDGKWQDSPVTDAAGAIARAEHAVREGRQFAIVHRYNELGQLTTTWSYSGGSWSLMSDRPGFSDILREEMPHNNF